MADINQGYASKSTAIRGAKRANLTGYEAEQREDGKWYIVQRVLPPGTYDATVSSVKVDATTGKVTMDINVDGVQVTSTIAADVDVPEQNDPTPNEELVDATVATPQRVLSPEAEAKIEELVQDSHAMTLRLAATFPKPVPSTPEEIEERRAERREKAGIPAPVKTEKAPSYKEMARSGPEKSNIKKPVEVIKEYLAEHFGTRSRKELIAELVAMGINVSTCRTQYQHFKTKHEAAK